LQVVFEKLFAFGYSIDRHAEIAGPLRPPLCFSTCPMAPGFWPANMIEVLFGIS
jgi:hypothetical protein